MKEDAAQPGPLTATACAVPTNWSNFRSVACQTFVGSTIVKYLISVSWNGTCREAHSIEAPLIGTGLASTVEEYDDSTHACGRRLNGASGAARLRGVERLDLPPFRILLNLLR